MGLNSESEEETEELRPAALVILLVDFFLFKLHFLLKNRGFGGSFMEKWIVFSNERVWAFFCYFSGGRFGQDGVPVCAVRSFSCLNRLRDVDCSIWNLKIWRFSMEFPAERLNLSAQLSLVDSRHRLKITVKL